MFLFSHSKIKYLGYIGLIALATFAMNNRLYAQKKRSEIESEKNQNLRRIKEAGKILEETRTSKNISLGQLTAIQRKIESHKRMIKIYSRELGVLQEDISEISIVMDALRADLTALQSEYKKLLLSSYKSGDDKILAFLFSSESFNQLYQRLNYLRIYTKKRKEQMELIADVQKELSKKHTDLSQIRIKKEQLLKQQLEESKTLFDLKGKQKDLLTELNKREDELRAELEERKEADRRFEKMVADLVERERKRRAAVRKRTKQEPVTAELSGVFSKNKKRLRWPVNSGFVASRFGVNPHPALKGIFVNNLGVDIQTNKGERVYSVFEGDVLSIMNLPASNSKAVFVQHGEYFTVYSNLNEVAVKAGQKVPTQGIIGTVLTDDNGVSVLQFQIWKNSEKLNPEHWLIDRD